MSDVKYTNSFNWCEKRPLNFIRPVVAINFYYDNMLMLQVRQMFLFAN